MLEVIKVFFKEYEHREVFTKRELTDLVLDIISASNKENNGGFSEESIVDVRIVELVG